MPRPDLFTFKSSSHLLKLSLSHALAQSTKLSVYETAVQATLADTAYIPKELALTGELALDRREAVKLTGRLFRLRVEVNLVSNVLGESSLLPCHRALLGVSNVFTAGIADTAAFPPPLPSLLLLRHARAVLV